MSVPQPDVSKEPTVVPPPTCTSTTPSEFAPNPLTASPEESNASRVNLVERPLIDAPAGEVALKSWLWLNTLDQKIVTLFAAGFLMLAGYHWLTLGGWRMQPIEIERQPERTYDFRIDINSAGWVEWTQIEGVGQATAEKIVADRDSKGAFRSVQDLLRVNGIGRKTLEKMRPFLREPNEQDSPMKSKL